MNGYCLADGWSPNKSCTVSLLLRKVRFGWISFIATHLTCDFVLTSRVFRSVAAPNRSRLRAAISSEIRPCRLWFTSNQLGFNCGLQPMPKKEKGRSIYHRTPHNLTSNSPIEAVNQDAVLRSRNRPRRSLVALVSYKESAWNRDPAPRWYARRFSRIVSESQ